MSDSLHPSLIKSAEDNSLPTTNRLSEAKPSTDTPTPPSDLERIKENPNQGFTTRESNSHVKFEHGTKFEIVLCTHLVLSVYKFMISFDYLYNEIDYTAILVLNVSATAIAICMYIIKGCFTRDYSCLNITKMPFTLYLLANFFIAFFITRTYSYDYDADDDVGHYGYYHIYFTVTMSGVIWSISGLWVCIYLYKLSRAVAKDRLNNTPLHHPNQ